MVRGWKQEQSGIGDTRWTVLAGIAWLEPKRHTRLRLEESPLGFHLFLPSVGAACCYTSSPTEKKVLSGSNQSENFEPPLASLVANFPYGKICTCASRYALTAVCSYASNPTRKGTKKAHADWRVPFSLCLEVKMTTAFYSKLIQLCSFQLSPSYSNIPIAQFLQQTFFRSNSVPTTKSRVLRRNPACEKTATFS